MPDYRMAFGCSKNGECPENHGRNGCPCWIVMTWTDPTGAERTEGECVFQALPRLIVEMIKASNRPAAAIESTRNEIVKGFATLAGLAMIEVENGLPALPDRTL